MKKKRRRSDWGLFQGRLGIVSLLLIVGCGQPSKTPSVRSLLSGVWNGQCEALGPGVSSRTILEFGAQNSMTATLATYSDDQCSANESKGNPQTGTYSTNGNQITITISGNVSTSQYSVSGNQLTIGSDIYLAK